MPEGQAEAFSEAFKDAQGEAELATKHDIEDLRKEMDSRFIQLEQRLIIKLGGCPRMEFLKVCILYMLTKKILTTKYSDLKLYSFILGHPPRRPNGSANWSHCSFSQVALSFLAIQILDRSQNGIVALTKMFSD